MPTIVPSILVYSKEEFLQQIRTISPVCDFVQVDIADGQFVENKTWHDPELIAKEMPIDFELHMMVQHPLEEVQRWAEQEHLKRIIFHYEAVEDVPAALQAMRAFGKELSICLNPETPVTVLGEVREQIDAVQIMSIHPGKQGQPFLPESIDRAAAIHATHPMLEIAADGHMNAQTIPQLFRAGVRRFGVGSAIWNGDAAENYTMLTELVHSLTRQSP